MPAARRHQEKVKGRRGEPSCNLLERGERDWGDSFVPPIQSVAEASRCAGTSSSGDAWGLAWASLLAGWALAGQRLEQPPLCARPVPLCGGCHPAPAVGSKASSCHGFTTHLVMPLQLVAAQLVTPLCIKSCPAVLVSAGIELIFSLVAGIVLWFGFSMRIMSITH